MSAASTAGAAQDPPRVPLPPRVVLPHRRPAFVDRVALAGTTFYLTLGVDVRRCRVREIFVHGGKEGSDMQALVNNVAILISVALQHGVPPAALAKSLMRPVGDDGQAGWASHLVPALLDKIGETDDLLDRLKAEGVEPSPTARETPAGEVPA